MLKVVEGGVGRTDTKLKKPLFNIGISDFVEEFFVGIAHDKNMVRMAKFFEQNQHLAHELRDNDFFGKSG